MFREIMAIRTSQMMTSRSLICLLENQNGGKLQKRFCAINNIFPNCLKKVIEMIAKTIVLFPCCQCFQKFSKNSYFYKS
jgi:hypothetical protein